MNDDAEDAQLLSVAGSIADRQPVNWDDVQRQVTSEQAAILDELRCLEGVARLGEDTPETWGPYSIVGEIGRGAFGTVYRAFDPELQRDVALKVIRAGHPDLPFDAERALQEARRLAKISHRNVVRVLRADRLGDEVGMSMELVSGDTLTALVSQRGPFSADEATLVGLDLCRALAAVHGTETLHGDVKAHNVMRSQGGEIVLMDFGTSKDLSRDQRRPDSDFAGTPLYLAPEVFAGAPRTKASDIYSLGVLLYYLVSGKYPVEGSTRTELGRQHAEPGARRPLRDARPDLPDAFVRVVEQALAETPSNRFASAGAFETALAAVVSRPAPAPAHTATPPPRPAPWKKLAVLATAGVILAGGGMLLPRLRSTAQPAAPSGAAALNAPAVANAVPIAPGSYTVDAAIFRDEKGAQVRLPPGARVSPGDALFLELQASVPAYVYIINEDEAGESYLLFPLPGQSLTNPLAAGVRHRLPGTIDNTRYSWLVSSLGGREHFLIFVSPERSTAFETLFASLPTPVEGKPIAVKLPAAAVGQLRGIGGLVATPTQVDQGIRKAPEFATPLPDGQETTRGLWIRQIAFENPARK